MADLQNDEDQSFRKIRLRAEDVQGKNVLTNFWVIIPSIHLSATHIIFFPSKFELECRKIVEQAHYLFKGNAE